MSMVFRNLLLLLAAGFTTASPLEGKQELFSPSEKWERLPEMNGIRLFFLDFSFSPIHHQERDDVFSSTGFEDLFRDVQSFISSVVDISPLLRPIQDLSQCNIVGNDFQADTVIVVSFEPLSDRPFLYKPCIIDQDLQVIAGTLTLNQALKPHQIKAALKIGALALLNASKEYIDFSLDSIAKILEEERKGQETSIPDSSVNYNRNSEAKRADTTTDKLSLFEQFNPFNKLNRFDLFNQLNDLDSEKLEEALRKLQQDQDQTVSKREHKNRSRNDKMIRKLATCDENCEVCTEDVTSCEKCLDGYFDNGSVCSKCNSECLTCDGGSRFDCLSCEIGRYLEGTLCYDCWIGCTSCSSLSACSSCADKYYLYENEDCFPCAHLCQTCSSSFSCSVCIENAIFLSNGLCWCVTGYFYYLGSCVDSCPPGTTVDTDGFTCVDVCPFGQVLDESTCVDSCPIGKVIEGTACLDSCSTGKVLYVTLCLDSCPDGKVQDGPTCVDTCPDTKFDNNGFCEDCASQCATCDLSSTYCLTCENGATDCCPEGRFFLTGTGCSDCMTGCTSCSSLSSCSACADKYILLDSGACLYCPFPDYFEYLGSCIKDCPSGTLTEESSCVDSCSSDKLKDGLTCVDSCPSGTLVEESSCVDSCSSGKLKDGSTCVDSCSSGKEVDSDGLTCINTCSWHFVPLSLLGTSLISTTILLILASQIKDKKEKPNTIDIANQQSEQENENLQKNEVEEHKEGGFKMFLVYHPILGQLRNGFAPLERAVEPGLSLALNLFLVGVLLILFENPEEEKEEVDPEQYSLYGLFASMASFLLIFIFDFIILKQTKESKTRIVIWVAIVILLLACFAASVIFIERFCGNWSKIWTVVAVIGFLIEWVFFYSIYSFLRVLIWKNQSRI